ncbi:hypothetical protein Fmac_024343 [Flemingia macrophylla]|uniref:F-box domain-containing protein n=1 Tax=Flemingia macrophylla TaxID=520843 RepID=A0ABD1LP54_9FABA
MLRIAMDLNNLPEGCIANILSFTCPRDVCRLSLLSSAFRSAAESDAVWNTFLPSDYHTLPSQSDALSLPSKKDLYLHLCQKPLLIDGAKKSFQLDKVYGKNATCYQPELSSLFGEILQGIGGGFLFQIPGTYGFDYQPVEVSIGIAGGDTSKRTVFLDAERGRRLSFLITPNGIEKDRMPCVHSFQSQLSSWGGVRNLLGVAWPVHVCTYMRSAEKLKCELFLGDKGYSPI